MPTRRCVELLVAADERRVQAALRADERARPLVEPDPAHPGELDRPGDDGSGALNDLARGNAGGQVELARRQHRPDRVVVGWSVPAEDGDEPLGPEALEYPAVPFEHVPHRCERLVEQAAVLLRIVGSGRSRREDGHEPELGDLAGRRRLGDLWGCGQLGILAQHPPLELLQLRRRVEPELVGEREPRRPVDLERLRLAAAAVEREHQLAAQPLAQGVRSDQLLQLPDERSVPAEPELGVDPLLLRRHAQLVETCGLEPREVLLLEIGERRPAPELERIAEQPGLRRRLRVSCLLQQALEAVAIDGIPPDDEPVAGRLRDEDVSPDQLAQRRHRVLERPGRRRGRALPPEVGDEPVGGHDLTRAQRQCGEEGTLLSARQRDDPIAVPDLERAEQADLHRSVVTPATSVSK